MILNIILAAVTGAAITALVAVLLYKRKPQKKKKPSDNMEFSKKIFLGLSILVGAVTAYVCFVVWCSEDITITQALVDNAFGLLKVGVVSYFGKSALENKIKLSSIYPKLKQQIFGDRGSDL